MSSPSPQPQERLADLCADRALFGLEAAEQSELESLTGDSYEAELAAYDRTLAALQDAMVAERAQDVPSDLEGKLLGDATAFFRGSESVAAPVEAAPVAPVHDFAAARDARSSNPAPWMVAAAAAVLAVVAWWPTTEPALPTTAQGYDALIAAAPSDLLQLDWLVLEDASTTAEVTQGEIVWSDSEQKGFMRFAGLAANDASVEQYQLWIFDRNQKDSFPIDGGVFDIPAGSDEVLIPIDPKIEVSEAWQFATTVEKPGGVVVSERGRLPLLATTSS